MHGSTPKIDHRKGMGDVYKPLSREIQNLEVHSHSYKGKFNNKESSIYSIT